VAGAQTGRRLVIEEPDVRTWLVKLLPARAGLMRSHFLSPPDRGAVPAEAHRVERALERVGDREK
jgi:hypothetical protein